MQIPFVSSRGIKNHGYWRRGKREPVAFNLYSKEPKYTLVSSVQRRNQINQDLIKNQIFTPKIGHFRPFFENLPILVEYSTGVEYSEGSQKIFLN